jgi:hypothetical protein
MGIPSDKIKRIPDLPDWETLHPGEPLPTNSKQPIYNPSDNTTYQVEQTSVGESPFQRDIQEGEISPKVEGDGLDMKDGCLSAYRSEGNYISGAGDVSLESTLVSNVKHLVENPLFGNSRTITIPDAQAVECGRVVGFYLDGEAADSGQVLIRTTTNQEINRETSQVIATPGKGFLIQEFGGEWLIAQDSRPSPGAESIFLYPTPANVTDPASYFKLVIDTADPDYPQTEQILNGPEVGPTEDVDVFQGAWTTEDDIIQGTIPTTEAQIDVKLNVLDPGEAVVTSFAEMYKRDSVGTETLINASLPTTILTGSQVLYTLKIFVPEITLVAGDRLVFKFYATKIGGTPVSVNTVQYAAGGFDNPARVNLPIPVGLLQLDISNINGLQDELDELNQMPLIVSQFDSNTTMADPGAGKFRINAGGTQIAISYQEPSGANNKIALQKLGNGSVIKQQSKGDDSKYKYLNVTGSITDNTTWAIIPINIDNEGNSFILDDFVGFIFIGGAGESQSTPLINATFDTGITDADPGAGNWRYNNATQSAATQININEETGLNAAITIAVLDSLKNGATFKIECLTDINKYAVVKLSADAINASTFTKLPLDVVSKGFDFEAGDQVAFVLLNSGGEGSSTYTELTDTPASKTPKKLQKINDAGTLLEDTTYDYDQVVNTDDIDVSDPTWQENESRLLEVKKVAGEATFEGATQLIDIFAPPGNDAALINQSGWSDETKTLTGENFLGQLGKTGQLRVLVDGTICRCISSVQGTDGGGNGSATYRRNRAVDTLDPANNTQDSDVADLLDPSRTGGTTDDGWNLVTNVKVISTIPARLGTWWKISGGYSYFCYSVSGSSYYWFRDGSPAAIYRYITTTSHPTLTSNLLAHDFGVSVYTEVGGDETSYQDQVFYNLATREYFVKVNSTQWEKLR